MSVETGRGVLKLALEVERGKAERVTVAMGEPILVLPAVPVQVEKVHPTDQPHVCTVELPGGERVEATFVSMGNPHAVIFVPDVAAVDLQRLGPMLENHPAFPRRINVHFVQVQDRDEVTVRTWERGAGVTLACGTGACAVAVAGVLTGRTDREVLAHLPGGDLVLEWQEADNNVYMTGPAAEVFSGEWNG